MKKAVQRVGMVMLVASLGLTGCSSPRVDTAAKAPTPLSVFYAGSMTKVMEQVIRPTVRTQLDTDLQGEGQGSKALAQMIRSGIGRPDVFISASPSVNSLLMGDANHNLERWFLTLAQDQLVIAYSAHSRFATSLHAAAMGQKAWYKVLETKGLRIGRTDPLLDPKGASTIFLFELAQQYYHQPGLAARILGSDENSAQVFPEETLLAQLTSGQVDAIVAYRHEAVEWKVPYITLPSAVNLGDASLAKTYAGVSFRGKNGAVEKGSPILFTISIPSNAQHVQTAERFVRFMVAGSGHELLLRDGFTNVKILLGGARAALPTSLRSVVKGTYK